MNTKKNAICATVNPEYLDRFEELLKSSGFIDRSQKTYTGMDVCGMKIFTSKEVPMGEVWIGYQPELESMNARRN